MIGRFRNILTRNGLQERIFAEVENILVNKRLILKKGTIVDSTFIESPSSTKNREKKRDPEAHSAKKGNTWHFGYKAHIGVDEENGLIHTVKATAANKHDVTVMSEMLHGEEERAYGDSGYAGASKCPEAIMKNKNGKRIKYITDANPQSRSYQKVVNMPQRKENTRNHLYVAKWSMFFSVIKIFSNIVRHATEVCKIRPTIKISCSYWRIFIWLTENL